MESIYVRRQPFRFIPPVSVREVEEHGYPEVIEYELWEVRRFGIMSTILDSDWNRPWSDSTYLMWYKLGLSSRSDAVKRQQYIEDLVINHMIEKMEGAAEYHIDSQQRLDERGCTYYVYADVYEKIG